MYNSKTNKLDLRYIPMMEGLEKDIRVARDMAALLTKADITSNIATVILPLLRVAHRCAEELHQMHVKAYKDEEKNFEPKYWFFEDGEMRVVSQEEYEEKIHDEDEEEDMPEENPNEDGMFLAKLMKEDAAVSALQDGMRTC